MYIHTAPGPFKPLTRKYPRRARRGGCNNPRSPPDEFRRWFGGCPGRYGGGGNERWGRGRGGGGGGRGGAWGAGGHGGYGGGGRGGEPGKPTTSETLTTEP